MERYLPDLSALKIMYEKDHDASDFKYGDYRQLYNGPYTRKLNKI